MTSPLVVSVHDVAPSTVAATLGWVDDLDRLGVRASLLVVPGPWRGLGLAEDDELCAWLRQQAAAGHEIAQHGWIHEPPDPGPPWRRVVNEAVSRGCGEFWSLEEGAAKTRLLRGRSVLWGAGLDPVGFTPPGWLASAASVRALRSLGYGYTTTHRAVHDLRSGRRLAALALSNRPGSPAERLGCEIMRRAAQHAVGRGRIVRIALHPDDRLRPGVRDATLATIVACLEAGAQAATYAELVAARAVATP